MGFAEVLSQAVTQGTINVLSPLPRPASGTSYYRVVLEIRNGRGIMEDPDDGIVYLRVVQANGTVLTGRLFADSAGSSALVTTGGDTINFGSSYSRRSASVATGRYEGFFSVLSSSTEEALTIECGWKEQGLVQFASRTTRVGDAADLDTVDTNVSDALTRLGLGTDASVAFGTGGSVQGHVRKVGDVLGTPAGASVSVDVAAVKTEVDKIGAVADAAAGPGAAGSLYAHVREIQADVGAPTDLSTADTLLGLLGQPADAVTAAGAEGSVFSKARDVQAALGLGTDAAVAAGSAGSVQGHLRDAQAGIDLLEVDLGDFSAEANLGSLKSILGALLHTASVPLWDLLGHGLGLYKVAASPAPGAGTFALSAFTGGSAVPTVDDAVNGVRFVVLTGTNKGQGGRATDYTGATGLVTFPGSLTLAANDVVALVESAAGYLGSSNDAAATVDSPSGGSLFGSLNRIGATKLGNPADAAADPDSSAGSIFAWLKHLETHLDLVDAGRGPQENIVKVYPVLPTAVISANPTIEDVTAANTGDSTTFVVLDNWTWRPPETTAAAIYSIFADLRVKASAPAGAGASQIKFALVVASATVTNGSAAPGGTVDITDAIALTTTETEYIRSGLAPSSGAGDAIPATDGVKLLLLGKVTTTLQGGITAKMRSNTALDIHWKRT